jgi:RimJ/RimL family protein N-acetyltransferase
VPSSARQPFLLRTPATAACREVYEWRPGRTSSTKGRNPVDTAVRSRHHCDVTPTRWPLFQLRLVTERLLLRPLTDDDLDPLVAAVEAGIHPPDQQPFGRPWTDGEPDDVARRLYQFQWQCRASWSVERWRLPFVVEHDGEIIGSQDLMTNNFLVLREVTTGSWLTAAAQGRGFGKEMRAAALTLLFDGLGGDIARTEAMTTSHASIGVTRALGYRENGHTRFAPRGVPQDVNVYEMNNAEWQVNPAPRAQIENLAPCLSLFGLAPQAASRG